MLSLSRSKSTEKPEEMKLKSFCKIRREKKSRPERLDDLGRKQLRDCEMCRAAKTTSVLLQD